MRRPYGDQGQVLNRRGPIHQLVLKERPKDDVELRIPVAADGLKLRETSDDRLQWESDNGNHVATAPVPVMSGATEGSASGEPAKSATSTSPSGATPTDRPWCSSRTRRSSPTPP